MAQGPMSSILVMIRISIHIRESVPDHDSDPDLLCWRSTEVCALSLSSEYF